VLPLPLSVLRRTLAVATIAVATLGGGAATAGAQTGADGGSPTPGATSTLRPPALAPEGRVRVFAGPLRRWNLGGRWWVRADPQDVGLQQGWQKPLGVDGWSPGTVPSVPNATDDGVASMSGGVHWYRRELRLPALPDGVEDRQGRWILRFERTAVDARVFVGGTEVTHHRGAYEPFEVEIPPRLVRADRTLTVTVRTDSRRTAADLPPGTTLKDGTPSGGWWNEAGIPQEVTLRFAEQLDVGEVQLTPNLPCPTCSGTLALRVTVRNMTGAPRRTVRLRLAIAGREVALRPFVLGARGTKLVTHRFTVPRPRVWSPDRPQQELATLSADLGVGRAGAGAAAGPASWRRVVRWRARTGFRSVRVKAGRLEVNFRPVNLRGVGVHEQDVEQGGALTDAGQDLLLRQARELGGLVLRGHYPFHPRILEEADRLGLLVWSEIPVYQLRQAQLAKASVKRDALRQLRTMIRVNGHHPSIFTWSVGNEMTTKPGPTLRRYFRDARAVADERDRTRPLSYARQAGVQHGCVGAYGPLDLIGINDYFGWYGGPNDALADPANLGPFLDGLRRCHPNEALMVTETGAEANRSGDLQAHGTYEFQRAYAAYHFAVYRSRPWLSGAIWWGLREFRVRPNWAGGNWEPTPPWHGKGLLDRRGWTRKPAWQTLHDEFAGVDQLAPASTAPVAIPPSPQGNTRPLTPGEEGGGGVEEDGEAAPTG
jgi:hypothetical protein